MSCFFLSPLACPSHFFHLFFAFLTPATKPKEDVVGDRLTWPLHTHGTLYKVDGISASGVRPMATTERTSTSTDCINKTAVRNPSPSTHTHVNAKTMPAFGQKLLQDPLVVMILSQNPPVSLLNIPSLKRWPRQGEVILRFSALQVFLSLSTISSLWWYLY